MVGSTMKCCLVLKDKYWRIFSNPSVNDISMYVIKKKRGIEKRLGKIHQMLGLQVIELYFDIILRICYEHVFVHWPAYNNWQTGLKELFQLKLSCPVWICQEQKALSFNLQLHFSNIFIFFNTQAININEVPVHK